MASKKPYAVYTLDRIQAGQPPLIAYGHSVSEISHQWWVRYGYWPSKVEEVTWEQSTGEYKPAS